MTDTPTFLDQKAAAILLHISTRSLERFRLEGRGPAFTKIGRRVVYARDELLRWARAHTYTSTAQASEAVSRKGSAA